MYAMILAGGKGERLRPLTDSVPKPMVEVNGQPILRYQISWLKSAGVTDVVLLTGYLGHVIRDYFDHGEFFGVNIQYSHEDEPLGRGGAIKKGLGLVPEDEKAVVVMNGDIITDFYLDALIEEFHIQKSAVRHHMASILTVPYQSSYGTVDIAPTGLVRGFQEKPVLPYYINAGVYVLDPAIRELLPDQGDHEVGVFPRLALHDRMTALRHHGFWISVDSMRDLQIATNHLDMR